MYKFSELSNSQIDDLIDGLTNDISELHINSTRNEFGYFYKPNINLIDDALVITLTKNLDYLPDVEIECSIAEYDPNSHTVLCDVTQVYYRDSVVLWETGTSGEDLSKIGIDMADVLDYFNELNNVEYAIEDYIEIE